MVAVKAGARARAGIGVVLVFVGLLAAVFMVWNSARRAAGMAAAASSDEKQFAQAAQGQKTKVVIEISQAANGTIRGQVLQQKSETVYARTSTPAVVHSNAQTKIVMGKREDVRAGAVVHVTGSSENDHSITAEQIVILTGYVKVQ
jgi:Na+-transporting methylmalonyl-CoA/oxaloacetate decarboxylase gamma subunit